MTKDKNKRKTGTIYERQVEQFLRDKGYRILEHNFNCRSGEIDLIALDGNVLVFAEVKYRKNHRMGYPEEAVSALKRSRICRSADYYRLKRRIPESRPCRFDVIAVEGNEIRHYENAFSYEPGW